MAVEHRVKCWPNYFDAIKRGEKPFDVRRDDRGYQKGDIFIPSRFAPGVNDPWHWAAFPGAYESVRKRITYILTGGQFGIKPGYVVLGLADE